MEIEMSHEMTRVVPGTSGDIGMTRVVPGTRCVMKCGENMKEIVMGMVCKS